jgi:glycolate oxidase FAD binding subunit
MAARAAVLQALRKVCGEEHAREADKADVVVAAQPSWVAVPANADEAAGIMQVATEHHLAVLSRGAGTKLDWGAEPSAVDLVVDLSRLDSVVEHAVGDLVVVVQAGVRLSALQDVLGSAGQMLALDETVPGATVGGTVSTATSGPYRMLYGTPRDLLIGVSVVLADGTVAKAGGKVVKNVAGYDLGKLYTGSFGTLGIITQAAFRLHPRPAARNIVWADVPNLDEAVEQARALRQSQLALASLEMEQPSMAGPITVAALIEGTPKGVETRTRGVTTVLGSDCHVEDTLPTWWAALPWDANGTGFKVTSTLSGLGAVLTAIHRCANAAGVDVCIRGSLGVGVLYLGIEPAADGAAVSEFLDAIRSDAAAYDGTAVVMTAPKAVRDRVDLWGPVRGFELMRRIKEQFDPEHRLAPGRFVGGL